LPVKKENEATRENEATKKRRRGPVKDSMNKLGITPTEAAKTIGYGYSRIAKSIIDNISSLSPTTTASRSITPR
jgi:hypothetical protein